MNKKINYRLPAEWEKHKSTILGWPHQKEDWPGKFTPIPWVYTEIVKNIAPGELVRIIVQSPKDEMKARKLLTRAHVDLTRVQFIVKETDRGWLRDSSPAFVRNGKETTAIQFTFNGWAKYGNHRKDQEIPTVVADHLGLPLTQVLHNGKPVVLEGGAIDGNGCGTLLTTEECLMDNRIQVRNYGFTKSDYETVFREYFGVTNVIWLGQGIEGDDTHGHVDDICRFVNRNTVVACKETDRKDKNSRHLAENLERLQGARLENGDALNVVTIPMPKRLNFEDLRLPASYVNFMIIKGTVLVPTFNDRRDYEALGIFTELFPDRDVIGISAIDLIWGLGTLHCLSHEIPA